MNIQENPHFTAYALGELNAEEASNVHAALTQVPAAAHELEQIEAVTDALRHGAPLPHARLTHEQRHAVLHPANLPRRMQPLLPRQPAPRPRAVFWPVIGTVLKAAAVVALTGAAYYAGWTVSPVVSQVVNLEADKKPVAPQPVQPVEEIAAQPMPEATQTQPVIAEAPPIKAHQPQAPAITANTVTQEEPVVVAAKPAKNDPVVVKVSEEVAKPQTTPNMGFAMFSGRAPFASTTKRTEDQYSLQPALLKPAPPKSSKAAAFASPQPANIKSEAKPPARPNALYIHSWQAEVASSPWNPGHRLLRIVVQLPADQTAVISGEGEFPLRITFDQANVKAFRMLCERHHAASELRTAGTHVIWYEFLPNGASDSTRERQIASVTLPNVRFTSQTVGPFDGSRLRVIDRGFKLQNARDDFLFEASVVGFGLLMRGAEQIGDLDHEMVLGLAQKSAGNSTERVRFVRMVQDAKRLAGL